MGKKSSLMPEDPPPPLEEFSPIDGILATGHLWRQRQAQPSPIPILPMAPSWSLSPLPIPKELRRKRPSLAKWSATMVGHQPKQPRKSHLFLQLATLSGKLTSIEKKRRSTSTPHGRKAIRAMCASMKFLPIIKKSPPFHPTIAERKPSTSIPRQSRTAFPKNTRNIYTTNTVSELSVLTEHTAGLSISA